MSCCHQRAVTSQYYSTAVLSVSIHIDSLIFTFPGQSLAHCQHGHPLLLPDKVFIPVERLIQKLSSPHPKAPWSIGSQTLATILLFLFTVLFDY